MNLLEALLRMGRIRFRNRSAHRVCFFPDILCFSFQPVYRCAPSKKFHALRLRTFQCDARLSFCGLRLPERLCRRTASADDIALVAVKALKRGGGRGVCSGRCSGPLHIVLKHRWAVEDT